MNKMAFSFTIDECEILLSAILGLAWTDGDVINLRSQFQDKIREYKNKIKKESHIIPEKDIARKLYPGDGESAGT